MASSIPFWFPNYNLKFDPIVIKLILLLLLKKELNYSLISLPCWRHFNLIIVWSVVCHYQLKLLSFLAKIHGLALTASAIKSNKWYAVSELFSNSTSIANTDCCEQILIKFLLCKNQWYVGGIKEYWIIL